MQEADARLADETRDSPGSGWGVEWWQSPQSGCNCSVRQAGFLHSEVQRQVFSTKTRSASLGCVCVEDHCSLKGIDSGKGSGSLVEASWLWVTRVVDGHQRTSRSFARGSCSSRE